MIKPCVLIISSFVTPDKFVEKKVEINSECSVENKGVSYFIHETITKEIKEGKHNITHNVLGENKDYSEEAEKFLEKRKPEKQKDINDIMYEVIGREIQEGKHDE